MANDLENPGFGNFSIQDTMEMGMGNAELLSDLMSPDTSTANPDEIKDINEPDPAPAAPASKKKAPVAASTEDEEEKEEPTKDISDFLYGEDEEEEEEEAFPASK